jgi:hypothetical protein
MRRSSTSTCACSTAVPSVNNAWWVDAGGLIGQGALTLTITDTTTNTTKVYGNAATNTTFPVTHDTAAFATCP